MSKATIALVAAASAAAGAAATAALYSSRPKAPPTATSPAAPSAALPAATSTQDGSAAPVDPTCVFQYGFPGPVSDLRAAPSLVSAFDRRTRNPAWVAEHITQASLARRDGDRKHSVFYEDAAIPPAFRARLADYHRSGYDRGHQVPAADARWSQEAVDATFALSNMAPQVGDGFNRDYWAHFEDFCRRLVGVRFPSVRVVTGPLYLPRRDPADGRWRVAYEVIGSPPSVAVPTHFFKVVFAEDGKPGGSVALGAFVLPNAPIANGRPLRDFEVPIDMVERASGLEFAAKLPAARRKRLCDEVSCEILVREYKERQKEMGQAGLLK
jgi:endonuclease G, mitochondrial